MSQSLAVVRVAFSAINPQPGNGRKIILATASGSSVLNGRATGNALSSANLSILQFDCTPRRVSSGKCKLARKNEVDFNYSPQLHTPGGPGFQSWQNRPIEFTRISTMHRTIPELC